MCLSLVAAMAVTACVPALAEASFPGANGRIAFGQVTSIWTFDADENGPFLADPPRRAEGAWSADGTKMVYRRGVPNADPGLAVVNADGTNDHFIQNDPGMERDPAWSPDGTKVVYWRFAAPNNSSDIFVANVDGTGSTRLTTGAFSYVGSTTPAWSPDGTKIAFARFGEIWTMNPDGTGEVQITNTFMEEREPNWSPDGARIAYHRSSPGEIAVMDADGSDQMAVASSNAQTGPVWSPDGDELVYTDASTLWSVDPDGEGGPAVVRPAQGSAQVEDLDWQPIAEVFYPRPKGATPIQVSLVPAYAECTAATHEHGPPLAFGSCNPPAQTSGHLTVGTADSNLKPTKSASSAGYNVIAGNPATPADEADVQISVFVNDVYEQGALTDYPGELRASASLRITDKLNQPFPGGPQAGTMIDIVLSPVVPCAVTDDLDEGAVCSLTTSGDALAPGTVPEGKRSIWELGRVQIEDGGADGDADTTGDNTLFMTQGVFVP